MMWETNDNLMELLSERYTFVETIDACRKEYYTGRKQTLEERLDEMYVSNAVRRPIYRTLDIVKDIEKAFGTPEKIFVEMARGGLPEQKGRRTQSRYQQILDYYAKCRYHCPFGVTGGVHRDRFQFLRIGIDVLTIGF